jgi:hypothetical protein
MQYVVSAMQKGRIVPGSQDQTFCVFRIELVSSSNQTLYCRKRSRGMRPEIMFQQNFFYCGELKEEWAAGKKERLSCQHNSHHQVKCGKTVGGEFILDCSP